MEAIKISPEVWKKTVLQLQKESYFVVDNVIEPAFLKTLRNELEQLYRKGLFNAEPSTKTSNEGQEDLITEVCFFARQLSTKYLDNPEENSNLIPDMTSNIRTYLQTIVSMFVQELSHNIPDLKLKDTWKYNKLACCIGSGGTLPKHLDNDGTNYLDYRKLTILLYLNPNYKKEYGGSLRIHSNEDNFREIEPCDGRLVVFFSDIIVHEVLPVYNPSHDERFTITVWVPTNNRSKICEDKDLYIKTLYKHFSEYIQ